MFKKILEKLQPILLLFSMALICVGIVWVVNQFKTDTNVLESDMQTVISQAEASEEILVESIEPEEVEEEKEGVVLAVQSTNNACQAITKIEAESVCEMEGDNGKVDFSNGSRSGQMVRKDSQIILTKVTVPLELFSGMEVYDSNRKITSETPTFKAAGEQIDDISANVLLPPKQQIDRYESWVEDEPFSTEYTLSNGDQEVSETGEVGVDEKIPNQCEYCNNKSNVNPDGSNVVSSFMLDNLRAPREKGEITSSDVIESCNKDEDRFEDWDTNLEGCHTSLIRTAVSFFQTIDDALWNTCATDSSQCMNPEDIVLKMASPFGSNKECDEDGICTNAYMTRRNNLYQIPDNTTSGKFYYLTPCKAVIEAQTWDIKCAWDMSHIYKERESSQYDDLRGVESTPTEDEYNNFLLNEIKGKRGASQPL